MAVNKYGGINDMPHGWPSEHKRVYNLWFHMLRRCYDANQHLRARGTHYADCSVCDRWMLLSNFSEDIKSLSGYDEWVNNTDVCLDKDSIIEGNRIYCPDACSFITKVKNIQESNKRNLNAIKIAQQSRCVQYVLKNESDTLVFNSEKEACKYLGVRQCSVASCFRKGYKCKGYNIERILKS